MRCKSTSNGGAGSVFDRSKIAMAHRGPRDRGGWSRRIASRKGGAVVAAAVSMLGMAGNAHSATVLTWDPTGTFTATNATTYNWDTTSTNFTTVATGNPGPTGNATWVSGDEAFFGAPLVTNNFAINVVGNETADSLSFQYGSESFSGTAGSSTITLNNGFNSSGNQSQQAITFANTVALVATQSQEWEYATGQSRSITINSPVSTTATAGNTVTLYLLNYSSGATYTINGVMSDGSGGGHLMVSRPMPAPGGFGTITLNGANTYTGGTSVDGGFLVIGSAGNLGASTSPTYISAGVLRLTAVGNFAPGNYNQNGQTGFLVDALGGLEINSTTLIPTGTTGATLPIDPHSSGFFGLDVTDGTSLNMGAVGDGTMFLGSSGVGAYSATTFAGIAADGVYRLGAGNGTLTISGHSINNIGVASNALIVGEPIASVVGAMGSGDLKITATQSFSGGATVSLGSTLEGDVTVTGVATPFGSTGSTITLNGGALQADTTVLAGNAYTVGTVSYTGAATVRVSNLVTSGPTGATVLNVGTLSRSANRGILQFAATGSFTTLGNTTAAGVAATPYSEIFLTNIGATTNNYNGNSAYMAPANLVDGTGNFLTYNSSGLTPAIADHTTIEGASSTVNSYVRTTGADATALSSTESIYALNDAGGNITGAGGTLTIASGGLTISSGTFGSTTSGSNINLAFAGNEALIYAQNSPTIYGTITGSNGLTKSGPGQLTLDPRTSAGMTTSNTFSGQITVNAGALLAASDGALGNPANSIYLNGATLALGGANPSAFTTSRQITLGTNGGFFTSNSGVTSTLNGLLTTGGGSTSSPFIDFAAANAGNVDKFIITDTANDFTAPIFVDQRVTLSISSDNPLSSTNELGNPANNITLNAGLGIGLGITQTSLQSNPVLQATSTLATGRNIFITGPINVGDNLDTDVANGSFEVDGVISGDSSLNVLSSVTGHTGTLVLTNANTYFGSTTIASGSLQLGKGVGGSTGGSVGVGNITNSGELIFDRSNTYPVANFISGAGSLLNEGSGVTSLSGSNTYSGQTVVTAGVLELASANALPGGISTSGGTSTLTINGGVVGLGQGDFTRGLGTSASSVNFIGGGGFAAYGADRNVNLGGGAATITFGSGNFVPSGSPLILGSSTATNAIQFTNPIDLALADQTVQVVRGISTLGSGSYDASLNGIVSSNGGAYGLIKTGNGVLNLAVANNYTGMTAITAGTLLLGSAGSIGTSALIDVQSGAAFDVSQVSGHTIPSGQTLQGNGTVYGSTTVNGTLLPGEGDGAEGQITVSNNLTLAGAVHSDIAGTAAGASGGYDVISVGGTVTYGGTLTINLIGATAAGDYVLFVPVSGPLTTAGDFSSITAGGQSLVDSGGVWSGTSADSTQTYTFTDSTGDFNVSAAPEPGSLALLGFAGLTMMRRRRAAKPRIDR